MADFTKTRTQKLDWTLLDDTGSDAPTVDSGAINIPVALGCKLHVVVAHADANDGATNEVFIKVLTKKGDALEDWVLFAQSRAGSGQATKVDLDAESASGQTQVKVGSTADFDTGELERLFILDTVDPLDSELITVVGWSDNDYYTAGENLSNTHAISADLLNLVDERTFFVPPEYQDVKVLFGNTDGDATYYVRVDYQLVTELV